MGAASWWCERADREGFVEFGYLAEKAAGLTAERFCEAFPVPGLLVVYRGDRPDSGEFLNPNDSRVQLLTVSIKSAAILRYLNRIAFVAKKPGNPYAHLISIGRSASNDISISVDSVSKVHGYFVRENDDWVFTDHSSTNGSLLNDKKLEPGSKAVLRDRDLLQLGVEVMLEYLEPASLYRRVTQL